MFGTKFAVSVVTIMTHSNSHPIVSSMNCLPGFRHLSIIALAVLLGACTTVQQGPTGSNVARHPASPDLPEEMKTPVPHSTAPEYKGKEAFDAVTVVEEGPRHMPVPPGAQSITLRMGEMREVYRQTWSINETQYAFFLPQEATNVVKLIVETHNFTKTYFVKAIGYGDTIGGVVERKLLDTEGFHPDNAADFARIQEALRKQPVFISVKE